MPVNLTGKIVPLNAGFTGMVDTNQVLSTGPSGNLVKFGSLVLEDSGIAALSGGSGYSGYSGPTGFSGYSGTSGYYGQDGASGYSGYSGSGYSGYSGIGDSGYSGYSGDSTSGYSGYSGESGYSGISGYSGLSGYSGVGYSGESGYSGYSGFSGYSAYSGYSGQPGTGVTFAGIWQDSPTSYSVNQWVTYNGEGWISLQNGNEGNQPDISPTWWTPFAQQGPSGWSGYSSYSGYSGWSGFSGQSGADIYTSCSVEPSGAQEGDLWWDTCDTQGDAGESGYSGFSGYSGYSGHFGVDGASGYSGYSGSSGYIGADGVSGYSGDSGTSGYSGLEGYSGYSGYSGIDITSFHTTLLDMPDASGSITDHDMRLVTKVMPTTPTVPNPFTGMLWWDTASPSFTNYLSVTNVDANYSVVATDECINATSNTFTITIPAATNTGRILWLKNIGTGKVTIVASGGGFIDGETSQYLTQYDGIIVIDSFFGTWITC